MPLSQPRSHYRALLSLPVSLIALREMRDRVRAYLDSRYVPQASVDDILLVMTEVFSTVIRHSPRATQIGIGVIPGADSLTFVLRDDGEDLSALLQARPLIETVNDELPATALGLSVIHALAPGHRYLPRANGTAFNAFEFGVALTRSKARVVIIDDDETQLCIAELFLSDDYSVTCFSDPRRALAHIFLEGADLIVSDIYMPDMDGVLLRKRLAANDETRLIPFIFLTGSPLASAREKVCLLSIDDVLAKPVEKDALRMAVARVLHRSRDVSAAINVSLDQQITNALWQALPAQYAGYRLSRAYRVAARGGGDLLVSRSSSSGLTLLLMDVMGHGEQAKFFAHAIAGFFHGLFAAYPALSDPARHLECLSEVMARHELLSGTLLTCLVAHLGTDGRLSLASAGHPPPWRFSPGQWPQVVDVHGVMPGLGVSVAYQVVDVVLQPGESLMLLTDGLFEATAHMRAGGDTRALTAAIVRQTASADWGANAVMAAFDDALQGPLLDDATVVVIQRE